MTSGAAVTNADDMTGTTCADTFTCDPAGTCVKKDGQGCSGHSECASGYCDGTVCSTAPRCFGLAATCGPAGNEDCCASLPVTGGTFYRSYDAVDATDTRYPATVADFYLDKYEATVGRFRQFVNARKGTVANPPAAGDGIHPTLANSGWDPAWNGNLAADTAGLKAALKCDSTFKTWTDDALGGNESRPQNCMNWYEAFAFCAWDGGRLPTEAEWNYAAAGGGEQRYYPWSSPPSSTIIDASRASYWDSTLGGCTGNGNPDCVSTDIIVVGSKPAGNGKWGHADLGGNVFEWTVDQWDGSRAYPTPCDNCADQTAAPYRAIRGGYFNYYASFVRASVRASSVSPVYGSYSLGVRCARTGP